MPDGCFRKCSVSAVRALVLFSVGLYLLHLLLAVCVDRALYSDGSFFFVENVSSLGYPLKDDEKHIRLLVNVLNQAPLSLGLLLGVKDLGFLRALFGFGLFFVPALLYFWCFLVSRKARDYSVFACALLSLVVFAMPSEMFALNQAFTALAICWVLVHYAILPIRPSQFELCLIALLGVVLFRAHESMLLWGVGLCFSSFAGLRRGNRFRLSLDNFHRYYIGIVGIFSSFFVLWWQFSHPVSQQTSDYLSLLGLLAPQEIWAGNTRISMVLLLGFALVGAEKLLSGRFSSVGVFFRFAAVVICFYVVLFSFSVFRSPDIANPFREYEYRFLMTFGAAVVLCFAPCSRLNGGWGRHLVVTMLLFSGLLAATIWQISNDDNWRAFKQASIRGLAYAETVVVSPDRVRLALESVGQGFLYKYRWSWTWPAYGLSLHDSREVLRIYSPEGFGDYFSLPKADGDGVRIPFAQLPQRGFFDFTLLFQACFSGQCH